MLTAASARAMSRVKGNRLVKVTHRRPTGTQATASTVATYAYDGLNRRLSKVITNSGIGIVPNSDAGGVTGIQAGDRTEHYYYAGWRCIEERNGSDQTLAQTVFGTQYIDEPVCRDRNLMPGNGSSCIETSDDARYFYHQDANYRVVALTNESGNIIERYEYDAYGEPRITLGMGSGSAELGNLLSASSVGNPYMHQGLRRDDETGLHENRLRVLHSRLGRFMQKDSLEYEDGLNLFEYVSSAPDTLNDPTGLSGGPRPKGSSAIKPSNRRHEFPPLTTGGLLSGMTTKAAFIYGPWKCSKPQLDHCKQKCKDKGLSSKGCVLVAALQIESFGLTFGIAWKSGTTLNIFHCCCDYPKKTPGQVDNARKQWDAERESFRGEFARDFGAWPRNEDGNCWPAHHIHDLARGGSPTEPSNVLPVPPDVHVLLHAAYRECYAGRGGWNKPGPKSPWK